MTAPTPVDVSAAAYAAGNLAFLDNALWKRFRSARTTEDVAHAWLALQCRFIDGASSGVVVLGEPDVGPYAPVAYWPDEEANNPELAAAAEHAMSEREGIVLRMGPMRTLVLLLPAMLTACASPLPEYIVDENALAAALSERRIAAAGLDVYEDEPHVTPTLIGLTNVVLLPHLGSATTVTRQAMSRMAAENALAVLNGSEPANPVN